MGSTSNNVLVVTRARVSEFTDEINPQDATKQKDANPPKTREKTNQSCI
jgi:hypothetical protein